MKNERILFARSDTPAELQLVKEASLANGATNAVVCTHWAEGGKGALELADAIVAATSKPSNFKFLYDLDLSIEDKINVIAKEMYGAGEVVLADKVIDESVSFFKSLIFKQACL